MNRFLNNPMWIVVLLIIFNFRHRMGSDFVEGIQSILLFLPGMVIGLAFHEFSHAFVAYKLGDNTPKIQGRVTVNPLAHIDPVGFIAIMFAGFGWGKPVEINPFNFRKRRRDEFLVSIAGVTMNLIIAVLFLLGFKILFMTNGYAIFGEGVMGIVGKVLFSGVYINIVLMVFNLIPIPPLDGFTIVTEICDLRRYDWYYTVYRNGIFILMAFVMFGGSRIVLQPIVEAISSFLFSFVGYGSY